MGSLKPGIGSKGRLRSVVRLVLVMLLGTLMVAPSAVRAAEARARKALLFAPFEISPGKNAYPWLSVAVTESLTMIFERMGVRVVDDPRGEQPLPKDFEDLTRQQALDWLGKDLASKTDLIVFGRVKVSEDQATLQLYVYDLVREREVETYKTGGVVSRIPSLILKGADALIDIAGVQISQEDRQEIFDTFTGSLTALRYFGESYQAGDLEGKLKSLQEAVAEDGRFAAAWMQLALASYATGRRAEAKEAFLKVIGASPRFKEAYNNLGVVLVEEGGAADQAAKAFKEALSVDGSYLDARFNLAKLLDREKKDAEALAEYEKLLKASPDNLDVRFLMALVLDRVGQPEKALEEFRRISPLDPSSAELFFLEKGKEARQNRRFADADAFFKRALDINPNLKEVTRERGVNSYLAQEYEQSVTFFRSAAEKMPDSAEVQHSLGLALVRTGRPEEAVTAFRKAVELGGMKESNLELGRIYYDRGLYADAIGSLNRYLKDDPGNDDAKLLLGQATRKAREETELMQKKADFAIRRLDKMEEIVRDLNRRNSELETRLALATERATKAEDESLNLRESKSSLETELNRRLREADERIGSLSRQLDELKTGQGDRQVRLEEDLAREKKARELAQENLNYMMKKLQEEGTVTILQGPSEEDLAAAKAQAESLRARLAELEPSLEKSRAELAAAREEKGALEETHRKELGEVTAARREIDRELEALRQEYARRRAEDNRRLEETEKASGGLSRSLEEAAGEKKALEGKTALLENDLATGRAELEASRRETAALSDELAAAGRKLEESTALIRELQALTQDLSGKLESAEESRDEEGRAGVRELEAELDGEKRARREAEREVERLAGVGDDFLAYREKTAAALEKLSAERDRFKAEVGKLGELQENLEARAGAADGLREKLAAGGKELEAARADLGALEKETGEARKELEASRKRIRELEKAVEKTRTEIARLTGNKGDAALPTATELEELLGAKQKELLAAQAALASFQRKEKEYTQETQASQMRIQDLEYELATARKKMAEAVDGHAAAVSERDDLRAKSRDAARQVESLGGQLADLRKAALGRLKELADLQRLKGQRKKAEETYLVIIKYDPENSRAYQSLGELYKEAGDGKKAKEMLTKASKLQKEEKK